MPGGPSSRYSPFDFAQGKPTTATCLRQAGLVRGLKRATAKLKDFGKSDRIMGLKLAAPGSSVAAPLLGGRGPFELPERSAVP